MQISQLLSTCQSILTQNDATEVFLRDISFKQATKTSRKGKRVPHAFHIYNKSNIDKVAMSELPSSEETKQSIPHYLTKITELHLRKGEVQYIVSANGKTQFSKGEKISNNHEGADTLIIHTLEQMKPINYNVTVHATNNDVFFLLLKHCKVILCHNLYISLVHGFVNITALMNKLGIKANYALLSLHAINGCDTVGKFNGISKEYWLKRFFENYGNHAKFKNELVEFQTVEGLTKEIERLICETYLRIKKKLILERIYLLQDRTFSKKVL